MSGKVSLPINQTAAAPAGKGQPKPSKRKARFSGILNHPMVWKVLPPDGMAILGGKPSDEERLSAQRENQNQLAERVSALFEHYKVDPTSTEAGFALALKLALDFVPGFEILASAKRGRGAPKKWDGARAGQLLADVASLTRRGSSAQNACRMLTKQPKFAFRYGAENPDNLYRRYQEAGRIVRADNLLGKLVEHAEAEGYSLDDWFIFVFGVEGEERRREAREADDNTRK
jgi:hypothetical protein